MLTNRDIRISLDGKGSCRDNVFVEPLWRTVKYDEVYFKTPTGLSRGRLTPQGTHLFPA